jgi:hypothetical protein
MLSAMIGYRSSRKLAVEMSVDDGLFSYLMSLFAAKTRVEGGLRGCAERGSGVYV